MKPYHKNPRQIKQKRFDALTDTLDRLGDLGGIVHNQRTDEVIGGNQRTRVFSEASEVQLIEMYDKPDRQGTIAHGFIVWRGTKFSYRLVDWDEATCEEANIKANLGAGDWDWEKIADEWTDVTGFKDWFDADLLRDWGRDYSALESFLASEEEPDPGDAEPQTNRAEELRQQWGVELGQMWRLPSRTEGQEHRLICGDCTEAAVVERVMGGERADIGATSPPYSVGKDYETDSVSDWLVLVDGLFSCLPTSLLWVNLANKRTGNDGYERNTFFELAQIAELHGYKMTGLRVWVKDPTWAGQNPYWRNTYKPVDDFEFIALFVNSKPKHIDRLTSEENNEWGYRGVWDFGSVQKNRLHSAAYPLELPERCLKLTSDSGAIVYEPFNGSGTTLIACENLARQCRAVEISPAYVAVALQRYQDAFGITPELIPPGKAGHDAE